MWLDRIIQTLASWLVSEQKLSLDDKLKAAGEAAIAEAQRLWLSDVYDPPKSDHAPHDERSRKVIDSILRACGWTWEIPYTGDGQVEWCGLGAGACWVKAGLRPAIAKTWFPSTYRLVKYATYQAFDGHQNPKPATGPYRLVANLDENSTPESLPFTPRKGDILIIGPTGQDKHICLVESLDGSMFTTIESNGVGLGPDHRRRQGIVRGLRALGRAGMGSLQTTWHARRLIRPAPGDLE